MSKSWNDIENHWIRLRDQSSFVLETPCVLIDKDGDLFETTLFDLIDFIDVPSTMSRQYLKDYLQIAVESQRVVSNKSPSLSMRIQGVSSTKDD